MTRNADGKNPSKNLEDMVREARKQLASQPLYIVATERGYTIIEEPPKREPAYFRVNLDGSVSLMVHDPETKQLLDLSAYPASLPNMTTADLALDEDTNRE